MTLDAIGEWKSIPSAIYLYVNDTDATFKRAFQAGGTTVLEPADQFYGDRNAGVKDPVGNFWWIATHKEDGFAAIHSARFQKLITSLHTAVDVEGKLDKNSTSQRYLRWTSYIDNTRRHYMTRTKNN